jgi:hydroxymethylpyrimidine/phosphomethylpyrimidine kinase
VLVKGGHTANATDILLNDQGNFVEFREEFIDVGEVHGSGCTLSAAIAAGLGQGMSLEEAVGAAKDYVTNAIRAIRSNPRIGRGAAPL